MIVNRQIILPENVLEPQLFSLKHLNLKYYFTACQVTEKAEWPKL